ncbi:metal ABC transporter substrate-binding protein [Haloprofundus salilacus]|uniref:metal ABC transporter substrate-binding protein n=1 Tax=Haloprofundus salilacus TaxID=2876190 RepID=UPI001CC909AA|nr:metal ABC transporter substrate-binding protein [Haloprofundus salilacus]
MGLHNRRAVLGLGAGTLVAALAGCVGAGGGSSTGGTGGDGKTTVQSSFFVLSDFAANVVGDVATVENLVPFGQHGHGWEPGPDVQRSVLESNAFVYMGEGFQPWADDVVTNLEDADSDIAVIEARHDVDLLSAPGTGDDGDEHGHDDNGNESHDEGTHNESHDDVHEGNYSDDGHEEEEHGDDGHDHGAADPHFWLDPTRAATAVETIRDGLVEMDPGNESTYVDNADAYVATLNDLDSTFEEELSGRTREDVLVAGHNAFQYLGERYEFHVHSLTGLAPDDQPTPQDVTRAQELIAEHDISHVLAPVFESDRAAMQLVEETDATAALPLTPVPTLKPEWEEDGWGFVDVMTEVNLASLRTALGAK